MKTDVSALRDRAWWPHIALGLILVGYAVGQVAVILLGSGLFLSHDEANFLFEGMRLPVQMKMGGYDHGAFMYEILAVMETVWYGLARVFGDVTTPVEHLANVLANPSPHIKAARLFIATVGLLCLVQVFRVSRLLTSPWAAVMATLLCACNLTFGIWTGMAKEDAIMWLLLLTAADLMWRASPSAKLRPVLAGVAIGAAFATKYFAFFGMMLALLPLVRLDRPRSTAIRQAAYMAAGALVSVLIFFPFLVIDAAGVLSGMREMSSTLAGMAPNATIGPYLFGYLPTIMGPFVAIAALAELATRLKQEPRGPILLFTPAFLILALLLTRRGYTAAHYVFPVAIAGFVLAAAFADRVSDRLRGRLRVLPLAILGGVAVFDPTYLSSKIKFALLVSGPDTRMLAAKKVEAMVPAGDCVTISGGVAGWNQFGPALAPAEINSTNPGGLFAQAERLAISKRPTPHYKLRIIDGHEIPTSVSPDCEWLVGHVIGVKSTLEEGPHVNDSPQGVVPSNFVRVAEVPGFPTLHSYFFPFLSLMDYEELASTSFSRLWRERAMGPTYQIHKKSGDLP